MILRKQREEKNYYDEYKDYSLEFDFEKLKCNKSSLNLFSSDEKIEEKKVT